MPRSGITLPDGRDRDAAPRLVLVSACDRGFRYRFTPGYSKVTATRSQDEARDPREED